MLFQVNCVYRVGDGVGVSEPSASMYTDKVLGCASSHVSSHTLLNHIINPNCTT